MRKLIFLTLLVFTLSSVKFLDYLSFSKDNPFENNNLIKPIVAIITNPTPINDDFTNKSTINSPYVSWLQDLGVDTLPLFWDYSLNEIDTILGKVNGVLLQGGGRDLISNGKFESQNRYIIEKANFYNIPIWFTCQGFEYLFFNLAGDKNILVPSNANKYYLPGELTDKAFSSKCLNFLQTENLKCFQNIKVQFIIITYQLTMKYIIPIMQLKKI